METVVSEIQRAAATLQLAPEALRLLSPPESEEVYFSALHHFVSSQDRRWWWEAFRRPGASIAYEAGDAWKQLPRISPNPRESVWLIAEEDQLPHHPVFETTPEIASAVIGQCYAFEYYLVAKNFSWLLCENHHNELFAIGPAVEERLVAGET